MDIPNYYLYKYRSLRTKKDRQYTGRIFTHNEIYFAKFTEFNDPFDCNLHISVERNIVAHKAKLRELNPNLSDAELDVKTRKDFQPQKIRNREKSLCSAIRRINKIVGIFSLSEKSDDLLMWSHYADYHRGICLEFKVTNSKLFGCDLSKVHYQKQYPNLSVYDHIDLEWTKRYLTTKSDAWCYEKEWRILYRETGCQVFPAEELSGVILGARISEKNKKLVLEWLTKGKCEVQLYQSRECDDRFGVNILPEC